MDVRDKLLTENPWKLMISLSLPAILGQFIVGLYSFVDSIYVGQMMRTDAMSAVSSRSEERRVGKECRSRWSPYH